MVAHKVMNWVSLYLEVPFSRQDEINPLVLHFEKQMYVQIDESDDAFSYSLTCPRPLQVLRPDASDVPAGLPPNFESLQCFRQALGDERYRSLLKIQSSRPLKKPDSRGNVSHSLA